MIDVRTVTTAMAYAAFLGMLLFFVAVGTPRSTIIGAGWGVVFVVLVTSNLYFLDMARSIVKDNRKRKLKQHF